MVAIFNPPATYKWSDLSFASTLYLCPILDLLLDKVPNRWRAELRLGLQEALVNAAKHGNCLDPTKTVSVRFAVMGDCYWWIISDQGVGFKHPFSCQVAPDGEVTHHDVGECGRGLFILYQVFDQVHWTRGGRELQLCKQVSRWSRIPLVS